jgi:glycosyltransferase involved in cell wall biosynthesis
MSLNAEGSQRRKLKVLACAYACVLESGSPVSGGEAVLGWNLARQLARFHEVWVLTATSNRSGIEAELQRRPVPNLTFHYVDLPGWMRPLLRFPGGLQFYAYLWQIRAYFAARKLHQQVKFDVFHHITFANDWMASYIGALLPIPFLRGPGGGAHRTPEGFLREYSFGARFWERFRSSGQWVLRHDPFYVRSQRRAKVILLCNREAAEAVPKPLRYKVQLFPVNGISAEDLRIIGGENGQQGRSAEPAPDPQAPSRRPFEVLYAGKLLGLKGVALGIRGFALFAQRHADVKFSLVGDGPERARLETLIQELGVGNCVHLHKWVPRSELLVLMRASDLFLFPSLRDGGGAVVVEALAAGKPVICMDLAGPGLHVTENCGIKIPPQSTDQTIKGIADALERLYGDRELLARMGKAARHRAEEAYVLDKLGDRLRGIYESVLGVKILAGVIEVEGSELGEQYGVRG